MILLRTYGITVCTHLNNDNVGNHKSVTYESEWMYYKAEIKDSFSTGLPQFKPTRKSQSIPIKIIFCNVPEENCSTGLDLLLNFEYFFVYFYFFSDLFNNTLVCFFF